MDSPSTLVRQVVAIVLLLLAACASEPVGHKDLLDFLSDGATRREDVQLKLGEPIARYESDRILAYRLSVDEAGYVLVKPRNLQVHNLINDWKGVRYSLILVFDQNGVLRRHSLVEVHAP